QSGRDLTAPPGESGVRVTPGTLPGRGPGPGGVLDRLVRNPFPTDFVALKGNHEQLFETFLRDPSIAGQWRRLGGLETLRSYGVQVASVMVGRDYEQVAAALPAAVPQAHLNFPASLRLSLTVGRYFFLHAGGRPAV